jgi:hypothetical protein
VRLVAFPIIAFGVVAVGCLDPTEIILDITSDIPCSSMGTVTIFLQHPSDPDPTAVTQTQECAASGSESTIGSLVIIPGDSNDAAGTIIVATTVNGSPSTNCASAPLQAGCVVARRKFAFEPHTTLTIPIDLQSACTGVVCDPNSTCVNGSCVAD